MARRHLHAWTQVTPKLIHQLFERFIHHQPRRLASMVLANMQRIWLWHYITCATSKSIFKALKYINVDSVYIEVCKKVYDITNTAVRIAATNKYYGGLKINVPNVVFSNGNIDPWSSLSLNNVTGTVNSKSEVLLINGTSHTRDMYSLPGDSCCTCPHCFQS